MKRIGIITWHHYPNVGSCLQAYALQQFLTQSGFSAEFINYREFHRPKLEKTRAWICRIDRLVPKFMADKLNYRFVGFTNKYLKQSDPVYKKTDLSRIVADYSSFICGSDQIWAPSVFNDAYFLSFVGAIGKKKISYAPSIGLPEIPDEKKETYRSLLSKFDHLSIREEQGAVLLQELGFKSKVVCDPTLLLTPSDWDKLSRGRLPEKKYTFCYFLGENQSHRDLVKRLSREQGTTLVIFSRFDSDKSYADIHEKTIGPCEFLKYIKGAEFVVTDSFHGLLFSTIYRKNFYVVERFGKSDKNNQNSRIYNILKIINQEDRLLKEYPTSVCDVNWSKSENLLEKFISESKKFLLDSLNEP